MKVNAGKIQNGFSRFQLGDGQQIFDQERQSVGIAINGAQKTFRHFRLVFGAVQQGFDIAFDQREWRAQFMADIGDEFLACVLQALDSGQVMEYQDRSLLLAVAAENGRGIDLEYPLFYSCQSDFECKHLAFLGHAVDQGRQFMDAQDFENRFADNVLGDGKEVAEGAVGHADPSVLAQDKNAFNHAVKESFLFGQRHGGKLLLTRRRLGDFFPRCLLGVREPLLPPAMVENPSHDCRNGKKRPDHGASSRKR